MITLHRDTADESGQEIFSVSGFDQPLVLRCAYDAHFDSSRISQWVLETVQTAHDGKKVLLRGKLENDMFQWTDGSRWVRGDDFYDVAHSAILSSVTERVKERFHRAGEGLLRIAFKERSLPTKPPPPRWKPRLVTLRQSPLADPKCPAAAPMDIEEVMQRIDAYKKRLRDTDIEDESLPCHDVDIDQNYDAVATKHREQERENVNDWYQTLADDHDFNPDDPLVFDEGTIALPLHAICCVCNREDKSFSKGQLQRHTDDRRCKDCLAKDPAAGAAALSGPVKCASCQKERVKEDFSDTQWKKGPSKRKCKACFGYVSVPTHQLVSEAGNPPEVVPEAQAPQTVPQLFGPDSLPAAVPLCAVCHSVDVSVKTNCTSSQWAKAASRRKCITCASATAEPEPDATQAAEAGECSICKRDLASTCTQQWVKFQLLTSADKRKCQNCRGKGMTPTR